MITMFWNLCLLRTGPERMPTGGAFVGTVLVLNFVLNIGSMLIIKQLTPAEVDASAASMSVAAVAAMAAIGVVTYAILSVKGLQRRFAATFVAILGSDMIITTVQSALLLLMIVLGETIVGILLLASLTWAVIVIGFIFQRALEVERWIGIALGVLLILTTALISTQVNPPPPD